MVLDFELTRSLSWLLELSADTAVDFAMLLDEGATLFIWREGVLQRCATGMVASFEQGDTGFHQTCGSLTISCLKTAVYQIQSDLNRNVPLEELLRQLSVAVDNHQPASPVLMKQIDERWNALLSRYHQLTQQADAVR